MIKSKAARVTPLALSIAVLFSGCAGTGDLRPFASCVNPAALHVERTFAGVKVAPQSLPNRQWWKSVGDSQLDELVAEALADNPAMALVDARVRAALAAEGAFQAAREPTLNASANVAGSRLPPLLPPVANGHFHIIRYGYLSFRWNLDLWGGKRAAWQAAVGNARAAQVDAQAARVKLSADVVQAYFNLAGAHVMRNLARAELQRAEGFRTLTQRRVADGIDNRLSLARIRGEMAIDRAHLAAAGNAVHTSGLVLAALLGRGPDAAAAIRLPRLPAAPSLTLPSDLPANLLGRRPDVIAARWRVEATGLQIKAAKTKFLPNISISSLAGLIAPSATHLFSLPSRFYSAAPALNVPVFEGGALRANLAAKDAAHDIAVARYNQTLVHAISQVAIQVDHLRSLSMEEHDAEQARASAAEAYTLSMRRYHAGVGSFLEALSVRQQLITAERQLAALRLSRSNAWALLNEALGGGFQPASGAPSFATTQPCEPKQKAHA